MKRTSNSGEETKSKKILVQERDQSLSDPISQEQIHMQDQYITFEDAKDALNILIAQCGSPLVRKAHRGRLLSYLVLQERRLRTLERRAKIWGYEDETEHCLALAKMWDEVDEEANEIGSGISPSDGDHAPYKGDAPSINNK